MPAKTRSRRRRYRKYLKGMIDHQLSLGTLTNKVLIGSNIDDDVDEKTFISSVDLSWSLKDLTIAQNDGPVIVGIAHSDYSDAEIEAVIENTGSWKEGDLVLQEIAKRKVRIVGTFENLGAAAEAAQTFVLNGGIRIKTKLGWILTTGQTLKVWAYNAGEGALSGTSELHAYGVAHLWPR